MKPIVKDVTPASVLKSLFYTFVFNTIIAVFLTAIQFGQGFFINFIFSQCIGLSICTCVVISIYSCQNTRPVFQAAMVAGALPAGKLIGALAGTVASGLSSSDLLQKHGLVQLLFLGIMFGSIITYIFASRAQIAESRAQAQEEKIKRLTSDKKMAEANLNMLQAQIEPHFLFNTLSNVVSLLDTDTEKGKSMLNDFISYLRTSLSKIRGGTATLGQEMEMIRAYLNIFKVRMGKRLTYRIHLPEDTVVKTRKGESLIKKSIQQLCKELDPDRFWRIHRGTIVNVGDVAAVTRSFSGRLMIQLKGLPEALAVSRPYAHLFKQM